MVLSFEVFHGEFEMIRVELVACADGNRCSVTSARLENTELKLMSGYIP
jgi:hypothetical protein